MERLARYPQTSIRFSAIIFQVLIGEGVLDSLRKALASPYFGPGPVLPQTILGNLEGQACKSPKCRYVQGLYTTVITSEHCSSCVVYHRIIEWMSAHWKKISCACGNQSFAHSWLPLGYYELRDRECILASLRFINSTSIRMSHDTTSTSTQLGASTITPHPATKEGRWFQRQGVLARL